MLSEPMMISGSTSSSPLASTSQGHMPMNSFQQQQQHLNGNASVSQQLAKSPHFIVSSASGVAGSNPTLASLMTSVANEVNDPLLSSSNGAGGNGGSVSMETDPEDDAMLTKLLEECISSNANNPSTSNGMEIYH